MGTSMPLTNVKDLLNRIVAQYQDWKITFVMFGDGLCKTTIYSPTGDVYCALTMPALMILSIELATHSTPKPTSPTT